MGEIIIWLSGGYLVNSFRFNSQIMIHFFMVFMDAIDIKASEYFKWVRYALNPETDIPQITDWNALMVFSEKQALTGLLLPAESPENIGKELLLQWIGKAQLVEQQNRLLNKRVEQLWGILEQDGFRCCLLKGQGNAAMYPNPMIRCAGDIDVWVDADKETVYQYVRKLIPEAEESYKHIHFPFFDDVKVDVHVTPLRFFSRRNEKNLQRWIEQNKAEQFDNRIRFSGGKRDVCVPTFKFNVVYQLGHMFIHFFGEGLGLRQVVDYFYVLRNLEVTEKERMELVEVIKSLGLYRFARAVMWIENCALGLPGEFCIVSTDERNGRGLLNDILEGGNFGKYSNRYNGRSGFYYQGLLEAWRDLKLLSMAPREVTTVLLRKMKTAIRHTVKKLE